MILLLSFFFFQAEDGIRDYKVTGVQTCALPILETIQIFSAGITSMCGLESFANRAPDLMLLRSVRRVRDWRSWLVGQIGRASCREREERGGQVVSTQRTATVGKERGAAQVCLDK